MPSLICAEALTFVVAPLPNALFSHCGADDFSADYEEGSGPVDLGRFITAMIVVSGFALPLVLAHSEVIKPGASVMSIIGGGCVQLTYHTDVSNCATTQLGLWHDPGLHCCFQARRFRIRVVAVQRGCLFRLCNVILLRISCPRAVLRRPQLQPYVRRYEWPDFGLQRPWL